MNATKNNYSLRITDFDFETMKRQQHGNAICHIASGGKYFSNNIVYLVSLHSEDCKDAVPLFFSTEVKRCFEKKKSSYIHLLIKDNSVIATLIMKNIKIQIPKVVIVGSDFTSYIETDNTVDEQNKRLAQTFGARTTALLKKLRIGVVGVSGTGSPTAEMLYRLGVDSLVLVDSDKVEEKNLGRIYNSARDDIGKYKVNVISEAYTEYGLKTEVVPIQSTTRDCEVIHALSQCDFIFGCVDTHSGRAMLDSICNYYLIPIIDVGVKLIADGNGGISGCCYAVNYIKPGSSTLFSRKVINSNTITAEDLKYTDPEEYNKQLSEKYIKGVNEDSPAVISINTMAASTAVTELLARVHPFRNIPNSDIARLSFNLMEPSYPSIEAESVFEKDNTMREKIGKGDTTPLIGYSSL